MPSEVREPPQEMPRPEGSRPDPMASDGEIPIPPTPSVPITSTSGDDLSLSLIESVPDPFLDEFKAGASSQSEPKPLVPGIEPPGSYEAVSAPGSSSGPSGPSVVDSEPPPRTAEILSSRHLAPSKAPAPVAPTVPSAGSFEVFPALSVPPTTVEPESFASDPAVSADLFPPIDFSSSPSAKPDPVKSVGEEDEEDEEDDLPPRRVSWPLVLIASYASALTLFVIWDHRKPRAPVEPDVPPPAADTRPDPGRRADQSTWLGPTPIAPDHLTSLGEPIQVGALEVTPLAVRSGPITLERVILGSERNRGGTGALKLRLRLRNVSNGAAFFPLDEAFLRESERGGFDSFIELEHGATIELYPLAVTSEWSIVGQEFRKLKPGESYETVVVSAADALKRKAPEMTWRLRLRTGIEQTDVIGVRFRDSDIQSGP